MPRELADIYPLLEVDDMVKYTKPDWKCVFTYVQSFYRSSSSSSNSSSTSTSSSPSSSTSSISSSNPFQEVPGRSQPSAKAQTKGQITVSK